MHGLPKFLAVQTNVVDGGLVSPSQLVNLLQVCVCSALLKAFDSCQKFVLHSDVTADTFVLCYENILG